MKHGENQHHDPAHSDTKIVTEHPIPNDNVDFNLAVYREYYAANLSTMAPDIK